MSEFSDQVRKERGRNRYERWTKHIAHKRGPLTMLGVGALFFLLDSEAKLAWTMTSRAMTAEEWANYSANHSARMRKSGELERCREVITVPGYIHGGDYRCKLPLHHDGRCNFGTAVIV